MPTGGASRLDVKAALQGVRRRVRRSRLVCEGLHLLAMATNGGYRDAHRAVQADFDRFLHEFGGEGLKVDVRPVGVRKKALIHHVTSPYLKLQALLEKALQAAGYDCVTIGARSLDFLRYDWLVGNEAGYLFSDFDSAGDPAWVAAQMPALKGASDWLALTYHGVHVGQFVLALVLRQRLTGQLDFADAEVCAVMAERLNASVSYVIASERLLDEVQPDFLLVMDRGYSGAGELFELALLRGIDVVTWNFGYKSDVLALKRYNLDNVRDHPLCPSVQSWAEMRALPWSKADGEVIRDELFGAYKNQDWFSAVGTQFDKKILSQDDTRATLGLERDKKVAVIFPHILWDGSFFYGEDLFQDYTEWLVETIKAACANDRLQWVIKLHPAHVVKAVRENYHGKPAELAALEGVVDTLPDHVKLIYPDAPISTYSLFQIADYVVTVRGTVGIESALFGVPVITAGTGRYDRRGFTIDSKDRDEYRARLASLETVPTITEDQIQLAERYAYYVFLCRPLRLSCASLEYARDGKATPIVTVRCQSREDWLAAPDIAALSRWFNDRDAEDFIGSPFRSAQVSDKGEDERASIMAARA